jgi:hypothetical protein
MNGADCPIPKDIELMLVLSMGWSDGQLPLGPRNIAVENLLRIWSSTALATMYKSAIALDGPISQFSMKDANIRNTRKIPDLFKTADKVCERCGDDVPTNLEFHSDFICPIYDASLSSVAICGCGKSVSRYNFRSF